MLNGRDPLATRPRLAIDDDLNREAMGGIATSILDFDEIDAAEARDMLAPSVELKDSLLRVHRSLVVYIAEDDRAARTVAGTVGISPYLIIPHATVLCDESLLEPFDARPLLGSDHSSVQGLAHTLRSLEVALRTKWVPNSFAYRTERELYDRAGEEGGTTMRRTMAESLLLELKTRLQLARETQRARFEAIVTGLLGAVSVVQFDSVLVDATFWLQGIPDGATPLGSRLLGHAFTLALAAVAGLAIYLWKSPGAEDRD
jgi:hypothetical protein